MFEGYWHFYTDDEMRDVAILNADIAERPCFWQRRDLIHLHMHWQRTGDPMPEHLRFANSDENWTRMRALYESRKAAGFPGSKPIPA